MGNESALKWQKDNPERAREIRRRYYENNRERELARCREYKRLHPEMAKESQYRRRYGIGFKEYEALSAAQGGLCAICGNPPGEDGRPLQVDHCHATGAVRGLLCWPCNLGLGGFKDDLERARKAVAYLERWSEMEPKGQEECG